MKNEERCIDRLLFEDLLLGQASFFPVESQAGMVSNCSCLFTLRIAPITC